MKIGRFFLLLSAVCLCISCEDAPPTDYIPEYIIDGVLYVDQPLGGVKIYQTQAITDTFRFQNSIIKDATVYIYLGAERYQLNYRDGRPSGEYRLEDTTISVLPDTTYRLEVLVGGRKFTGETRTPGRIDLIKPVRDTIQFPKDTFNLNRNTPDSLNISWKKVGEISEYILSARCLDTLNYGMYLNPPTEEKNRRITVNNNENDPRYNENSRYGYWPSTTAPLFWAAFKWYGPHEYTIFAPDKNFFNWMKLTRIFGANVTMDLNQCSIFDEKGRKYYGVFGSTSTARKRVFVLKNQP